MTTLNKELSGVLDSLNDFPEAIKGPLLDAKDSFAQQFDTRGIIQVGDALPHFRLPGADGVEVSSEELLASGPILISFYRGEWCPFCNTTMRAFQKHMAEIRARGVTFVAITPELPDASLATISKNNFEFLILSDLGLEFAKRLNIVWEQPDALRPAFAKLGFDLKERNGDDSFQVPVPVTLLVDKEGIVRNVFAEGDFSKRIEPQEAIGWIDKL